MAKSSWQTQNLMDLCQAFLLLKHEDEVSHFLRDLLTMQELDTFAQRWQVARMLHQGKHFAAIEKATGASSATITRVNRWLKAGEHGYADVLAKIDSTTKLETA